MSFLRHDITHLDLSHNNISDFYFLRSFKHLKTLVIDGNKELVQETLPPIPTLEVFYANKCNIEFPRSFLFHISVVFENLKILSMMTIPIDFTKYVSIAKEIPLHRLNMYAIFMLPHLRQVNGDKVTKADRRHANRFHKYLGPQDCKLSKFETNPAPDDIRKIVPVHIPDKTDDDLKFEAEDYMRSIDDELAAFKISRYFQSPRVNDTSAGNVSTDNSTHRKSSEDEGFASMAPSD